MGTIEPWSFLDESVAYLQRFENDAPRLFANEAEAWDIQYFGALWNGLSDICK
jgi:hypothetical protein